MTDLSKAKAPSLGDVASLFRDHSGDESGGQHAIRGFTFQVWQAVLEILKAHATGEDYAIVLEWQQDIAVLDSSQQPTRVRFIQLKKNESSHHWTLHGLLTTPGDGTPETSAPAPQTAGKKPKRKTQSQSTLAKLYVHRRRFASLTPHPDLVFASNAPFYVGLGDDGDDETVTYVQLSELPAPAAAKIEIALRKQLEIPAGEQINLADFALTVTNCPTEEAHKFAIGELVELCVQNKISPAVTSPFVAVCLIASYVQQRAGKRAYAKDFPTLLQRSVTRTDVTGYFAAANDTHVRTQDLVEQVIARLNLEVADYELVQEMESELNAACAEVTNRVSVVWPSVGALVKLYAANDRYKASGNLKCRLPMWLTDFRALKIQDSTLFTDGFLYCLMAMILKDAKPFRHLSTAAPGAQSEAAE